MDQLEHDHRFEPRVEDAVLVQRVKHSEGRELNRCLGMAGALEWLYGMTFVIGAVI